MYLVCFHIFSYKFKVQRTPTEFELPVTCDHALSLYLCNLFLGGGRYFFPSRAKEAKKIDA